MPINNAAAQLGSVSALARAVGVQPPTVHQWRIGDRPVPVEKCVLIERATDGAVTRQDLRPDDYWLIWPDLPAPEAAQPAGQGA